MKYAVLMCIAVALVGCSTQPKTIAAQDIEDGVVGAKPEGYPKSTVKPLPDQPGFCVEVTERYKERNHEGQTIWLKEKTVASISCTKQQWERLERGF
jgi:hypothetical protein